MRRSFDWLARPYRWLEYLSFGPVLQQCRCQYLPQLGTVTHALVLGDGDGRFTARLLRFAPDVRVLAIDSSPGMLAALQKRCAWQGAEQRVKTFCHDLREGLPDATRTQRYDLVATHFVLDCLSQAEVRALARHVVPLLSGGGLWVVSEFHVPDTALRIPGRLLIWLLYAAFHLLTGLEAQRIPAYDQELARAGLHPVRCVARLGGIVQAELWVKPESTRAQLE